MEWWVSAICYITFVMNIQSEKTFSVFNFPRWLLVNCQPFSQETFAPTIVINKYYHRSSFQKNLVFDMTRLHFLCLSQLECLYRSFLASVNDLLWHVFLLYDGRKIALT